MSLDFDIFAVISAIEGELSDIAEVFGILFLLERVAAMLKRWRRGSVASDQINCTDEASHEHFTFK